MIVPSFHFKMLLGRNDAAAFKQVVKNAKVTMEGRVKTPENAEMVISAGDCDLVSIVRGQIADPHLVRKVSEGRAEDIRPCISCNQLCLGRRLRDYYISCLVNPSVSREHEWDGDNVGRSSRPKTVLVVGGGPAGLEAARVAAERGHHVRLVERSSELGGQFRLAAGQPERGEIGGLLNWYQIQLRKLQVKIELNKEITADEIKASGAEEVILCTGSNPARSGFQRAFPHIDRLPGADQPNVHTAHDVLEGTVMPGSRVLLLDDINGWWPASGTALHLAQQRHQVTIVTSAEKAAAQLDYSSTGDTTRERFAKMGVEVLLASAVESWRDNTATIVNLYTGDREEREFDSLVMALTNEPETRLQRELAGERGISLHAIGDSVQARTASMAIYEARKLVTTI
jgi:thioredoxin reductase